MNHQPFLFILEPICLPACFAARACGYERIGSFSQHRKYANGKKRLQICSRERPTLL